MNLYLKQKVFSWGDKFTVYDEAGNDVFYVQGEVFSFGKKLHILDLNGNELRFIHQKLLTFLPRFFIAKGDADIAQVIKEFTFFRQAYTVEGFGWRVEGDFFAHEYQITSNRGVVADISKRWFSWGDAYQIRIGNDHDPVDVLAVVLVIDACIEMARSSANSTRH